MSVNFFFGCPIPFASPDVAGGDMLSDGRVEPVNPVSDNGGGGELAGNPFCAVVRCSTVGLAVKDDCASPAEGGPNDRKPPTLKFSG